MDALLVVGGFLGAAGLLWLTPRIDPDKSVPDEMPLPAPATAPAKDGLLAGARDRVAAPASP